MAERTLYELLISLAGTADPSLQSAFNKAKAQVSALESSIKKVNTALGGISTTSRTSAQSMTTHFGAATRSMQAYARGVATAWTRAGAQMRAAMKPITGPLGALGRFTGVGAGVAAVGGAFELEQLAKGGWEVHASREASRISLETILKNRGMGNQTKAFEEMLLRLTSDETKIDYETAFKSTQLMMNSGKVNSLNEVHTFLTQLSNLGGTPAESAQGMLAISKMLAEGRIEGRHLMQLAADLPAIPWYTDIAKVLGMKGGTAELRKSMSKPGTTYDAAYLLKVLQMESGPGGRVRGLSAEQMAGPAGLQFRMGARWKVFEDMIGKLETDAILPLLTRITGDIDVEKLSHALDAAATSAEKFGKDISSAYGVLQRTGALSETGRLLGDISNKMGAAFGIKGSNSVEVMTSAWNKMNDALRWIRDHFEQIKGFMTGVMEAWAAIQLWTIGAGVIGAIGTLAKGLLALDAAASASAVSMNALAAGESLAWKAAGPFAAIAGGIALALSTEKYSKEHAAELLSEGKKRSDFGKKVLESDYNPNNFPSRKSFDDLVAKHKEELAKINQVNEAMDKMKSAVDASTSALQAWFLGASSASNAASFPFTKMGHFPIGGLSDPGPTSQGWKTYEQYGTEGPSSNFHNGVQLTQGGGVGLGEAVRLKYGVRDGDKVHIPGVGWLKINEKSSRDHGVEFFKNRPGSGPNTPDRLKIDQIQKGANAPINVSINYSPTIHGGGDERGLSSTLKAHSEHLAKQLESAMREHSRLSYA